MIDLSNYDRFDLRDGWYLMAEKTSICEKRCFLYDANDCMLMDGAMMEPERFAASQRALEASAPSGLVEALQSIHNLAGIYVDTKDEQAAAELELIYTTAGNALAAHKARQPANDNKAESAAA